CRAAGHRDSDSSERDRQRRIDAARRTPQRAEEESRQEELRLATENETHGARARPALGLASTSTNAPAEDWARSLSPHLCSSAAPLRPCVRTGSAWIEDSSANHGV